jgi:arginine:pyruvate transaminase
VLTGLVQAGDEVLVGDPMYATYEGLIRSTGAAMVPVPLRPERGFRMAPEDVAARVTPATRVLFLNSPHNPTGAVLRADDLRALGAIAEAHDLWIVSDEVYEELTFGADFVSPFDLPETSARTVACSSISKSHAAPGFRSGWCVGPAEFTARLLPLSETMLFGNQPFIAEMTALAVSEPSAVAAELRGSLARRADLVVRALDGVAGLRVSPPEAGMFVLIDVRATGRSGEAFARGLLEEAGVALMPGASFGAGARRLGAARPHRTRGDAGPRLRADRRFRRQPAPAQVRVSHLCPTAGTALIGRLKAHGVELVFGIPGVHTIELYRGIEAHGLRHVTPRHEQGAGFMADGYARVSGRPGVALVITGPGLTNALTAMAQARADSVPMLVISGVNATRRRWAAGSDTCTSCPTSARSPRRWRSNRSGRGAGGGAGRGRPGLRADDAGQARPGPHRDAARRDGPARRPARRPAGAAAGTTRARGGAARPGRRAAGRGGAAADPRGRRGEAGGGGAAGPGRAAGRAGADHGERARADARPSAERAGQPEPSHRPGADRRRRPHPRGRDRARPHRLRRVRQ